MYQQFKNDALSTLSGALGLYDTSLSVAPGQGDLFPVIIAPNFMILTLEDTVGNIERVKVTARAGMSDVMTIERAQEGTVEREWSIGSPIALRVTAAGLGQLATRADPETLTNKTLNACFAETPAPGDADLSLANTAFVAAAIAAAVSAAVTETKQAIYPIGSVYHNAANAANPATLLGFGTWEPIAGRVLVGLDAADTTFATLGATGGSKDSAVVAHTHDVNIISGGQSADHGHSMDAAGDHTHSLQLNPGNGTSSGCYSNGYPQVGFPNPGSCGAAAAGTIGNGGSHSHTIYGASNDHNHSVIGTTALTGGAAADTNLQPFTVVHMWKRVA